MPQEFRCDCPVTSALDVLGDRWMLVIVKLMLLEGKKSFKEFSESDEHIASNILSAKLKILEEVGIISKNKLLNNKKANVYLLTEKGIALVPIIAELINWSDKHLRDIHPEIQEGEGMLLLRKSKADFVAYLETNYRKLLNETTAQINPA